MKNKIRIFTLLLTLLLGLSSCAAAPIPEHASPYWAIKDGKEFQVEDGIVSFYQGKPTQKGYDDSALSVPFEYNHLFHEKGSYMKIRVDRMRQVRVVEETLFYSFTQDGEPFLEKRPDEQKFSVLQATVLQVFRNADWSDIQAGDVLMIYTEFLPEENANTQTTVTFRTGGVYYLNPARIIPQESTLAEILTIQELADYSTHYTTRYVFEQKGKTVAVPRCIWEGEGFSEYDRYQRIQVPLADFEAFYRDKIEAYTQP